MVRRLFALGASILLVSSLARAQELHGAGKVEIDSALLGGGLIHLPTNGQQPRGYVLDVATAANLDRHIGVEGDFAWSMSRQRSVAIGDLPAIDEGTPNMLFYTGNLIYNPLGHARLFVPYVEFGGGAMSVLTAPATFGIGSNTTHLAANIGGGLRWFPIPHWGARADYRYIAIRNNAAAGGAAPLGHAQRLYGALVLTF